MRAHYCNLFFLLLICLVINGQKSQTFTKAVEDRMVAVSDQLYADRFEISNLDYNRFLKAIADSPFYKLYLIDSLKWIEFDDKRERDINEPMIEHYHRHEGFNEYPAVNVPYEGAMAYCRWLTENYNKESNRKFSKVVFTLPAEEEWMMAAKAGNEKAVYPWKTLSLRDTRKGSWQGVFLANFTRSIGGKHIVSDSAGNPKLEEIPEEYNKAEQELNDRAFYTAEVRSFFPNFFGLYNMSGNAAEMTIVKGLTKGGSWHSLGGEITIQYRLYFYEPSPEVGFRVFMKVLEK